MTSLCVPGLLLDGEWIPPVRSYGGTTPSLSEIIVSASGNIFPSYYVSPFDLTLGQEFGDSAAVDLALVSKALEAWYLLFVEPANNADLESLSARIDAASSHPFGVREADELVRHIDQLTLDQARVLVHNNPKLIVVTDDPRHNWNEGRTSAKVKADVMIVEPFRFSQGYVIRVNGQTPTEVGSDVVGTCVFHAVLPNCLMVTWNTPNAIPRPGVISLRYGEVNTEWELLQGDETWQLQPTGPFPLQDSPPFAIVQDPDGTFSIRRAPN